MSRPQLVTRLDAWRDRMDAARGAGQRVGLVPTMGSLHAGHQSLIRRAAADCTIVAVHLGASQPRTGGDIARNPRDLDRDLEVAGHAGADIIFAPAAEEMSPLREVAAVRVGAERGEACLRGYLGRFDSVVAELLALSGPCSVYLGEKDYAQLVRVTKMVADLSLPVAVVGCPTVRHPDGLAVSTDNGYLEPAERAIAPKLYWALLAGKRAVEDDHRRDPASVVAEMERVLATETAFDLDHATVVDDRLDVPQRIKGEVRLLVAAHLGRACLVDSVAAVVPDGSDSVAADPFPNSEDH